MVKIHEPAPVHLAVRPPGDCAPPDLLYVWMPQSAVFGLLAQKPVIFEAHLQPTGMFGPLWHRAFARLRGSKRLACITRALHRHLNAIMG